MNIKSVLNKLKIKHIDVFIYKLPQTPLKTINKDMATYSIKSEMGSERDIFLIKDAKDNLIHKSLVFKNVHLLKLVKASGHVVGGCITLEDYRGQGFYPFMLNTIGRRYIELGNPNLFVIVDKSNLNSIRGIEKAGFEKVNAVKTKRFGTYYFKTTILKY